MASIRKRNDKYSVIYSYIDENGNRKQKWETYPTRAEALRRKKEIEFKQNLGNFVVRNCKTVEELIGEYITLYGKENWTYSTYEGNMGVINNYILPIIGNVKLEDINTRFIEQYYKKLLITPSVINSATGKKKHEYVSPSTIKDIHKILRSCFKQAMKWELIEKNPCTLASVPKHKTQHREIWNAETIFYAIDVCKDERLKLAINLAFSCTLRMGELLGLTWDCVDISTEAIEENRSYIFVNKELQRIKKSSLETLDAKDILYVFPSSHTKNTTLLVLKIPKTESSVRKVFLPRSVAEMLQKWKLKQLNTKAILGEEYNDYNLVMTSEFGSPLESGTIRVSFNKLIEEHHLPKVVFHSLRHSSVTYKLKLNKGDIKAVQGDSGHSQTDMVTDVYSHIIDEDRKKNAELFEDAFYKKNNLDPNMVSEEVDMELLMKALANPEMRALLNSLAKTMK